MSKYRYLEVFQRVPSISRYRESIVCFKIADIFCRLLDGELSFSVYHAMALQVSVSVVIKCNLILALQVSASKCSVDAIVRF